MPVLAWHLFVPAIGTIRVSEAGQLPMDLVTYCRYANQPSDDGRQCTEDPTLSDLHGSNLLAALSLTRRRLASV